MDEEKVKEQARLDKVVAVIDDQLETAKEVYADAHAETRAVEGNYLDNISINTIELDDAMETNAEVQQQRNIVARVVETETIMRKNVETLTNLRPSPYFGRIDIMEEDRDTLYIGLASLQDEKQGFLIYDWRAPISGIYYNGTLGPVNYETPAGEETVELLKKRQFNITDSQIVNMFDTDETVGDEMLQYALGQASDSTMRNIVATIQQEQNMIIRDTHSDLLVVQGVAGSGKTSAILQRIAFLLFHAREELNSDQIVLFSPNRLFSSYIADVLPSLGERNMRQVTLAEFLSARLEGLKVQTIFERYEQGNHQGGHASQAIQTKLEAASILKHLAAYVDQLTAETIHFTDINFQGNVFFGREAMVKIFSELPQAYSVRERVAQTQKRLDERLLRRINRMINDDWVVEALNNMDRYQYNDLLAGQLDETIADEENMPATMAIASHHFLERSLQSVADAIYNGFFFDIYEQYSDFLAYMAKHSELPADWWLAKQERFLRELEYHRIDLEDASPLLYLRDLLSGAGTNQQMRYVFVDEMQDYSMAQLLYLQHAFPTAKFTLLGDSEQALFREIEQPQALLTKYSRAFAAKNPAMVVLNKAYRSTQEIMAFAKALLPDGQQITAFTRSGKQPSILVTNHVNQASVLESAIDSAMNDWGTVAILTKTQAQANQVATLLADSKLDYQLLSADDRTRTAPVLIMPIYLAKGLEFDAVIGFDVSQANYPNQIANGLLYTLASRAMHELVLLSVGPATEAINRVAETLVWK
ncbi:possible DNA helicase [Weissella oryzae SG25]|uniref:Possible DNA helicase n=1 Tax=Weissella oryzae (strain DSM 25784 / JCM 18191 / LMG 30913 / SG25) TaxID=1329250 RepID=A0A069CUL4_WEIOS|nr:RNA polymerase recycling motor HelD [Weissella oryzae]GAK30913.1 possible DNA helicase [Weissella oryzae SG25]